MPTMSSAQRRTAAAVESYQEGYRLLEAGDDQSACNAFAAAIAADDRIAECDSALGVLLQRQGRFAEAIEHLQRAVALDPALAPAWNNLAFVCNASGRFEESLVCSSRALDLDPLVSDFYLTRGASFHYLGCSREAIGAFESALVFDSYNQAAHLSLGIELLTRGDFDRGWSEYEWRIADSLARFHGERYWRGEPVAGRRILVRCEQGFGDAIQFVRYCRFLKNEGASVILECRPELVRLFAESRLADEVVARGQPLPEFDFWCFLLTLPTRWKTRLETIPSSVPYLSAVPEDVERWRLLRSDDRLHVGIVWSGSSGNTRDPERSIPLEHFLRLRGVPGVQLAGLQVDSGREQLTQPEGLVSLADELHDFADTAAAMMALTW